MQIEIQKTGDFADWLDALGDMRARARFLARIERLAMGLLGDFKSVGDGVSELRVDEGPGYRVYFTRKGRTVIVLLVGGDKKTQARDIRKAKRLARNL